MLFLLAAAEFTFAGGVGQGFRAVHDTHAVAAVTLADRRPFADPFLRGQITATGCDPSTAGSDCHQGRSIMAGLRLHGAEAEWFSFELAVGLGQITAARQAENRPSRDEPQLGDAVPVFGAGLGVRLPLAEHLGVRLGLGFTFWPSAFARALVELQSTAGLAFAL